MLHDTTRIPSGAGAALMAEQFSQHADGSSSGSPNAFDLPSQSPAVESRYVSPALTSSMAKVGTAYEVKCLISRTLADELEQTLGVLMLLDPFAEKEPDGHYRITTLSTDTEARDCFHRTPGYAKRKYRLRRYGSESQMYLEQKTRRGQRVNKRRVATTETELESVFATANLHRREAIGNEPVGVENVASEESLWNLQMFHNRIDSLNLHPVCLMSYERRAWFSDTESGLVRWTLDRNLVGSEWTQWTLNGHATLQPILSTDQVICEFKFCGAMPGLFKRFVQKHQIVPSGFSKYRHCMAKLTGLPLPTATQQVTETSSDLKSLNAGCSHD